MIFDRQHFRFFGNREVNALNVSLALMNFGEGLISLFVPIYLWQLGTPIWKIIFFYFLISFFFAALSFTFLPLLKILSDKIMMFLSIPLVILYFLGLGYLNEWAWLFYALPLAHAANILLFNVGYHLDFSGASDGEFIGREVGTQFMISSLVSFGSPFIGGVLIAIFGFRYAFFAGSAVLFLAILPLFFFPKRIMPKALSAAEVAGFLKNRGIFNFTVSGAGYAMERMVDFIVWPLFLFFTIGNIEKFGGALSLGLLAVAVVTFLVGFLSDQGKRRRTLKYSTLLLFVAWVSRIFGGGAGFMVGNHVAGKVVAGALLVAWSSQYYKIARALPDASAFILSREVLYHLVRVVFLPVLGALAYFSPAETFFKTSFALAAALSLLFLFANRMPHTNELNH
ncbi:MAG: hypothetical protein HYW15_02970 [Candidatus Giovannonibacteria bacterium]|nr:MAG: hypothetical protein HYW15_02970 [Candidatus Giovannonibacteria bacterium]